MGPSGQHNASISSYCPFTFDLKINNCGFHFMCVLCVSLLPRRKLSVSSKQDSVLSRQKYIRYNCKLLSLWENRNLATLAYILNIANLILASFGKANLRGGQIDVNCTLIKKNRKISSYIRKFRVEQLQSHIWLTPSWGNTVFSHFLIY